MVMSQSPMTSSIAGISITQDEHGINTGRLIGKTLTFPSGAVWRLTKALTPKIYQQSEPPFEARQVFECVCVCDPQNLYEEMKDAIIKIKYQIKGTRQILFLYSQNLDDCRQALAEEESQDERERRLEEFEYARDLVYQAENPVEVPHRYTESELIALRHLRDLDCAYTPHYLEAGAFRLTPEVDEERIIMAGGYMIGILMTKVPGQKISYDDFWYDKVKEERDEIRAAFKTALLELWKCQIYPRDCALRNIMWDEYGRKCYIVDFEDWDKMTRSDVEAMWDSYPRWRSWQLSEDRGPSQWA
ncbi:hypothetical protein C7974DRAFT_386433 [Boeremia exigua]|uniref:uncharacterized protein n=1 Tax=Boeremia exigua TaxID=749465 RepID=UPI001E8D7A40|nr:uncharacterized protein C7974DRAFT_386433 [Boeremia exigua]KAH6642940.1 hypothetical protein C7974DRAFT_386433 [Boeremia exigua]